MLICLHTREYLNNKIIIFIIIHPHSYTLNTPFKRGKYKNLRGKYK